MEEEKNKVNVTDRTSCQNAQCYEAVKSNLPTEHKRMHKFTKVVRKRKTKLMSLTLHLVRMLNVVKQITVTYMLSIRECTRSRKKQVQEEKNKVHVTDRTSCQNDQCCEAVKSNLPPEHKRMHKFTEVVSREREKQSSCH